MGMPRSLPLTFSVVIPAYNEEKGMAACIESVLSQSIRPDQVVVINDGSTDRTAEILKRYSRRITVVHLGRNTGNKALALRAALPIVRGDIVVYTDGDSELDPEAIEKILPHFFDAEVGGVSGVVRSRRHNAITGMRELQYIMGQEVYKRGMDVTSSVMVIPGCVGAVRKELFDPSPDTVTEDMDLTLSVLERGYKVVYEPGAVSWTSDPPNLGSYIRQTRRWFAGFFQSARKHFRRLPVRLKVQIAFLTMENVLFFFLAISLLISKAVGLQGRAIATFISADLISWTGIAFYGIARRSRWDLLASVPLMLLSRPVDSVLWMHAMVNELILVRKDLSWRRSDRFDLREKRTKSPPKAGPSSTTALERV